MKKIAILSCLCFLSFSYAYDDKYYGKNINNNSSETFNYGDDKFYVKGHYYYRWQSNLKTSNPTIPQSGIINVNTNVYGSDKSRYWWQECNSITNGGSATQNYRCYKSKSNSDFINNDNDPFAFYDTNIEFYWRQNLTECYRHDGVKNNSLICTPMKFLSKYIGALRDLPVNAVYKTSNNYDFNNPSNSSQYPFTYFNLINSGFYSGFGAQIYNHEQRLKDYFNSKDSYYWPTWRDPGYAPSQVNGFTNPTNFNNGQKFNKWDNDKKVWGATWDGTIFFHPGIILGRYFDPDTRNDLQIYNGNFNFRYNDRYDELAFHKNGLNEKFQLAIMIPKTDRNAGANWNIDVYKMSLQNPSNRDIKAGKIYHFDANTANHNLRIINDGVYNSQTLPSSRGYSVHNVFGGDNGGYSVWILPALFTQEDLKNGAYLRFKLNYQSGESPDNPRGIFLTWRYINTTDNNYGGLYPTIFAPIPPAAFVPTRDTVRVVEETFVDEGKSKDNAINFMMRSPLLNKYAGKSTKRYCLVRANEDLINKRLLRDVDRGLTYNQSSYNGSYYFKEQPRAYEKKYFVKITNSNNGKELKGFIFDKKPIYDPNKEFNKQDSCFTLSDINMVDEKDNLIDKEENILNKDGTVSNSNSNNIYDKPGKITFTVFGQRAHTNIEISNKKQLKQERQQDVLYANSQSSPYINDYNVFYIQPFAYRISFKNEVIGKFEKFNIKKYVLDNASKKEKVGDVFELSDNNNAISWNYSKSNGSSDINKKQLDAFLNSNINLRPGIPYDNVLITPIKYNETSCSNGSGNNCISGQLSVIEDYYPKFEYNPEILSDTKNIDVAKSYTDKDKSNITGFDSGEGFGNSVLPGISVKDFGYNKPSPYLLPIIENNKHCSFTPKIKFTKNGDITHRYQMDGYERQGLKYKISVFDKNNDKLFKDSEFGKFVSKVTTDNNFKKDGDDFKKFKHELETYGYRCKLRPALKAKFEEKLGLKKSIENNEAISCDSDRTIPSTATFVPKIEFTFKRIGTTNSKSFIYSNIFDQTSVDLSPNLSTIANLDITLEAKSTETITPSLIDNFDKDCAATDVYAELNFNNGSSNNGSAKEQKIVFDENYPSDSKLKFDFLSDGITAIGVKHYNGEKSKRFYPDNKVGYKIPADLFTKGSASITIGVGFDKEINKTPLSPHNPFNVDVRKFSFTKIAFYNTSSSNKKTEQEKPVNFYTDSDPQLSNIHSGNGGNITVLNGRAYLNDDGYSPASGDPRYGISGNAPGFSRDIKYAFYCNNCGNGFDRFKGEGLGSKQNNWFVNKLETNGGDYIKTHLKSDSNSNSIEYGLTVDHPNTITIRHNNSNGSISEGKESILFSGNNGTKGILTLDLTKRPWFVGVDLNTPSNFNINDYIKQKISIQFGGITKPVWGGTNVSADGKGKDKIGVGGYVGEDINVPLNNRKGRINW